MKRIFGNLILSIFVVSIVFNLSQIANAQGFLPSDLSSYGISSLSVTRKNDAVCDGVIQNSEYDKAVSFRHGSGLYALVNDRCSDTILSSVTAQESYVHLSGENVYCALRLTLVPGAISPIDKNGSIYYRVSVSLGLTPGEHPALRGSLLTNSYYFSPTDFSCIGFTGERIARSIEEKSSSCKPLSTFAKAYRENGLVTSDGTKWNGEYYCKNAAFSIRDSGTSTTVVFEAKIPLEDVLLSVHSSLRESVRSAVKGGSDTLCGGFTSCIDLDDTTCLVAGLPTGLPLSGSANGESLSAFLEQSFETPVSGSFIPEVLPIPLYWCGSPQTATIIPSIENVSVPKDSPSVSAQVTSKASDSAFVPQTTTTRQGLLEENVELSEENDESIFVALPEGDLNLPEDTEILYDESFVTTTTKNEKNDLNLASSILATVTGALLFASVMVLCIYFRDTGKKESETQKKKKQSRSKNERR